MKSYVYMLPVILYRKSLYKSYHIGIYDIIHVPHVVLLLPQAALALHQKTFACSDGTKRPVCVRPTVRHRPLVHVPIFTP
jgi:hypothetical protein